MKGTKRLGVAPEALVSLALVALALVLAIFGLRGAEQSRQTQALHILEDSLRRAAVSCYAIEGRYPDTLDYLTQNYSVYVDQSRYVVDYRVFASNIMPDITVLEK